MASEQPGAAAANIRWPWLDGLRGVALVAMAIYHLTWDLAFFHFVPGETLRTPAFTLFGHFIACSFLAIAGFALAIASAPHLDMRKFFWRLGKIAAAAGLVTLATRLAFPDSFVSFGILHCIAVASLLSLIFTRTSWWMAALAGALIFAAGLWVETPRMDAVNGWLGLGERIPLTNDWRPIFPWAGAMLLGLAFGQFSLARRLFWGTGRMRAPHALTWAGRHSLTIYLVHQPALFAMVWLAAQVLQSRAIQSISPEPFVKACVARCENAGGGGEFCTRACSCIAVRSQSSGLWSAVAHGNLKAPEQEKYDAIIEACRKEAAGGL